MTNAITRPLLSKSTFVRGCKCLKSLHLYKHHYHLRDETSAGLQAIFDQGHEVGYYARKLFANGVDCSVEPAYDYTASVKKTEEALKGGAKVLYEAGFIFNNVYAAVDILVIKKSGWYVYEVKSSTEVKDYHYPDAAIQYYILKGLGLPVKAVHVVTINNRYVRRGAIEPEQLFTITNITKEAVAQQVFVNEQLPVFFSVAAGRSVPHMQIGPQCNKFYGCDFQGHCWKMFDDVLYPVHTIKRIAQEKLWDLIGKNILCQTQVPYTFPLSDHQKIQVHANRTQTSPEADKALLKDFLQTIKPPVAFLDFETFQAAIPLFDDTRPYQQVPFQYSIHLLQNGELHHYEFLGDGKTDPRKKLVEQMLPVLQDAQSILCYNMNFERDRLKELQELFPQHAAALQTIINKLVDLIVPFRSKYVYHYKMNGSASLKDVLPAFLPHLTYDNLEIKEGGTASQAYLNLFVEEDEQVIKKTREALLQYCKMDTFAMVELCRWLKGVVEERKLKVV